MTGTGFDATTARRWLGVLHGDSPGHILICSTGDWAGRAFTAGQLDPAVAYAASLDAAGREGIYVQVTSARTVPERGKRGTAADVAALPALWADLDLAGPGHAEKDLPPDEAAGRAVIAATGLPEPTIWVHSGGGLYPIWLLTEPHQITAENLDDAKRLAKDWQRVIEHAAASLGWRYGRGVGDLARVLRIPGTINRKEGGARPCRFLSASGHRYTYRHLVDALDTAIGGIAPPPSTSAPTLPAPQLPGVDRPVNTISPLDDYAARTDWADILIPAGWREHYRQDDVSYWTRPGKPTGTSASTNALGTDRLHVFTTAAPPLEGGDSYSKGGAYAALYHGGDHSAAARELAAAGYGTPLPEPSTAHREALTDILGAPPPAPAGPTRVWRAEIDATNPAIAADWLRDEAGRGKLAGLFRRAGTVVHTPREGEGGYLALTDNEDDEDGPAQVHPVNDSTLASRITYTYGVYRMVKKGEDYEPAPALFPRSAARTALDVPDMLPNLRVLRGVIHSPVLRPDGTLIRDPGYDPATGLLHLPEPGLVVPRVPDEPTASDVTEAVKLLLEMVDGFPFKTEHYRANFLGMLLTPLLRAMTPPPYKLHAIEAHQPGSGKTLLANVSRHIHGGVFRAEMPGDDTELRKQVTTILSVTTGPVVVIDNVSGALKSPALAGLLTSDQWDDRLLGGNEWVNARNDRLWTITGNNLSIGGDLPRRTIRTVIDPGVPNPELRTGFAITDLERWVKDHRGELLHALLVIVRAWVAAGRPLSAERASDGYARWVRTVDGILTHAGLDGRFDDPSTQIEVGSDDDEWAHFLAAVHKAYGDRTWTAKELLADIDQGGIISTGPIASDALPGDLAEKALRHPQGPTGVARSLGMWLNNRDGRWAGGFVVRCIGKDRHDIKEWRITAMPTGLTR
ncbi:hypothetical protein ACQPZX_41495 [Actinoplanes sp. CA-142083]|uniref:hypothetical protein n=1 Tax=Actinoplanes sp. CA-142083 TaxID=3239903 RepID=UPI003D8DF352